MSTTRDVLAVLERGALRGCLFSGHTARRSARPLRTPAAADHGPRRPSSCAKRRSRWLMCASVSRCADERAARPTIQDTARALARMPTPLPYSGEGPKAYPRPSAGVPLSPPERGRRKDRSPALPDFDLSPLIPRRQRRHAKLPAAESSSSASISARLQTFLNGGRIETGIPPRCSRATSCASGSS